MQFAEVLLILEVLSSEVLGEAGLTHICDGLVEGVPVELPHQLLDVLAVEVAGTVDALLHLDYQREVVLLAFSHVADQQVVGQQAHR
jgi:hypothetical protein